MARVDKHVLSKWRHTCWASWVPREDPLLAFKELHLWKMKHKSQSFKGQPMLNLQESFIIIRGKKGCSDREGEASEAEHTWLELVGPQRKGFGEVQLRKCHLAQKLYVRLPHAY